MRARRGRTRLAVGGLVLVLLGIGSYFVVALHFGAWLPEVRNSALPNWAAIAVGLALSVTAARAGGGVARVLAGVNLLLAGWFAWVLYSMSAVPLVDGPALGAPAPDFAARDQDGKVVRLPDFHGAPLLLVFYRGHW